MGQEEFRTVRYVTQGPIQNLRVRVTLTRLSALRGNKAGKAQQAQAQPRDAANAADTGSAAAADAGGANPQPPPTQPVREARVFGWQEKVYSRAELVAAQETLGATQREQQHGGNGAAAARPRRGSPRRAEHFGSQLHYAADRLLESPPEASTLFSYVHTDEFCERAETSKAVSTAGGEAGNHLVRRLLRDARNRQKMLNFRVMYIMVDLGDEHTAAGCSEKVLAAVRAHPDGSFDMQPGFSSGGRQYRFEDDHGGIYEYTLENASRTDPPCLERRAAKLCAALAGGGAGGGAAAPGSGAGMAGLLRRGGWGGVRGAGWMDHSLPPGPTPAALRLMVLGELVAGRDFGRDRLYVEWRLAFDPEVWMLQSPAAEEGGEPGVIHGVTHISKLVRYPSDPSDPEPPPWVAHWAHPFEAEWVAASPPPPSKWPALVFQVCSYDPWDRYTVEGYGWLQLGPDAGSTCHTVPTWKPLGTRCDQQQAFFIGGSPELRDPLMAAQARPSEGAAAPAAATLMGGGAGSAGGGGGAFFSRYGFKTEASGSVQVRLHCLHQTGGAGAGCGRNGGSSPQKQQQRRRGGGSEGGAQQAQRELSLAVVLERARARLEDARAGGGEVAVRGGVASAAPFVCKQPADAAVDEGGTASFSVVAGGGEPLCYRWMKDGRRLRVATADTPDLLLVGVTGADAGHYHCEVTNPDGDAASARATLAVRRVSRLQRVAAAEPDGGAANGGGGGGDAASPPRRGALSSRITVPRTLMRGGGGLPYNPRASSASPSPLRPLARGAGDESRGGSPLPPAPLGRARANLFGARPMGDGPRAGAEDAAALGGSSGGGSRVSGAAMGATSSEDGGSGQQQQQSPLPRVLSNRLAPIQGTAGEQLQPQQPPQQAQQAPPSPWQHIGSPSVATAGARSPASVSPFAGAAAATGSGAPSATASRRNSAAGEAWAEAPGGAGGAAGSAGSASAAGAAPGSAQGSQAVSREQSAGSLSGASPLASRRSSLGARRPRVSDAQAPPG